MTENTMVSVVVPTYNRAHMIDRALRSILDQSYRDIEIIVVDDGSSDNTEEVVGKRAGSSALPIRYLKKSNGGCASARNAGVREARGDCIAFLDSDDEFTRDAILALVAAIGQSGADFAYSPVIEVDLSGRERLCPPAAPGRPECFAREHFLTLAARSCTVMHRRHIFDRFMFDESARYNEDSDFLQKVAISFRAAYADLPTAKVYQHGGNKSSNRIEINRALLKSFRKILLDFPDFAQSVADVAGKRLQEIEIDLAEALIVSGRYVEGREVLTSLQKMPVALAISLGIRSPFPALFYRRVANCLLGFCVRFSG